MCVRVGAPFTPQRIKDERCDKELLVILFFFLFGGYDCMILNYCQFYVLCCITVNIFMGVVKCFVTAASVVKAL